MRAFIEKINGEWLEEFCYISKQALIDRGYNIIPFDGNFLENLSTMNINREKDICIGSVHGTN